MLSLERGLEILCQHSKFWRFFGTQSCMTYFLKKYLNTFTPSFLSRSNFSVKSFSLIFPVSLSVVILTLYEFRSLTTVEVVVLKILSLNSFPFRSFLITGAFPEPDSPKMNFTFDNYYILVQVCKLNIFLIDKSLFIFSLPKINSYNNTPTLVCRNLPIGIIQSTTTSFLFFFYIIRVS